MEKEANFANIASTLARNPGAVGGGVLGGAYGAYKGSQGPEGGLKGALIGGAQGAAGGAIIGGVGQKLGKSVMGDSKTKGVFTQFSEANKAANEAAKQQLGGKARKGLFSNFRNRRALAKQDSAALDKVKDNVQHIMDKSEAGVIKAKDARAAIDSEMKKHVLTNRSRLRDQIAFGGIGGAMAIGTGAKLVGAGSKAGESKEDIAKKNMIAQYRNTGKLDKRQLHYLTGQL